MTYQLDQASSIPPFPRTHAVTMPIEPGLHGVQPLRIPRAIDLPRLIVDTRHLEDHHVVGFDGRDVRSRPFNLLRSQLVKRLDEREWKMIGVTSATPAAGKSFLALNLAAALSRLPGRPIYLFDFDLRRGSVADALGVAHSEGLDDYLVGKVDALDGIGFQVEDQDLALFPCAPGQLNSAEMLAGPRFDALIAGMRALPDNAIVICDLPPAFANDDTIMVTQQLDAYLMVVEQGVTTKKQVQNTMAILSPTPCIGTALNRYSGGMADSYGYGYEYGYGYGSKKKSR